MKILVILGHPDEESFNCALARQYVNGAKEAGHEIKGLHLGKMKFEPILKKGYKEIQPLEPDLIEAQKYIKWADHITFVYPTWWASTPALLKGFIDRVFLPDYAFKFTKRESVPKWDRLLPNKSARLIVTMDSPVWYYKYIVGDPGYKMMRDILTFCGIMPVKRNYLGPMMSSTDELRKEWLSKAYQLGMKE